MFQTFQIIVQRIILIKSNRIFTIYIRKSSEITYVNLSLDHKINYMALTEVLFNYILRNSH